MTEKDKQATEDAARDIQARREQLLSAEAKKRRAQEEILLSVRDKLQKEEKRARLTNILLGILVACSVPVTIAGTYALYWWGEAGRAAATLQSEARPKINHMLNNGIATSQNAVATTNKTKQFSEATLTDKTRDEIQNYLTKQAAAALGTSNNSRKIADNLNEVIKHELRPMLADLRPRLNKQLDQMTAVTIETERQIKQNGDAARALIDEGRITIAQSREEVIATLAELRQTAHGLNVLTNDPELPALLHSISKSAYNVEVVSGDLAALSNHVIRPIVAPKKPGFFPALGRGLVKVYQVLNGAGTLFYIIQRLQ